MPLDLHRPIAEYFTAERARDGRVAGDFPDSPVTLDDVFRLDGDRISSLEIR